MSAYEIPNLRFSAEAGGVVAIRRFVTINATEQGIQAGANAQVVGASMNQTKAGEVLEIADGIVMVEAATALAAGISVASDANGKAIATPASTGVHAGRTITAAKAAGELVSVKI
ncbi:hypothetical protein D3C75_158380 [compost metagenome]